MILFEKQDLLDIIRNTLERFDDANLSSDAAKEAIARKVIEGVEYNSTEIDNEMFLNGHEN